MVPTCLQAKTLIRVSLPLPALACCQPTYQAARILLSIVDSVGPVLEDPDVELVVGPKHQAEGPFELLADCHLVRAVVL
ncbi:unnamed protein product [Sphagnum tenellum]